MSNTCRDKNPPPFSRRMSDTLFALSAHRELYPALARQIQPLVEEECDRMEYDGSFMFDEYPDQLQIRRVSRRIYDKLNKKEYQDDLMMQETNGRNWMEDFVTMMLLNEMYERRCRRRDRRCNWMY